MTYDYLEKWNERETVKNSMLVTACGMAVRLVFADKKNGEVPEIVGNILKGAYLQYQGI